MLACVGTRGDEQVDLGSASLTLVAIAEYQRATGDARYESWARRLANFILSMQKPNGDFSHLYAPAAARRDETTKLLYYSGEAVFGLAKLLAVPNLAPDPRWAPALDRGLDYLTGEQYQHLAGQFFFLEDHWTCMAADFGWERLPDADRRRYARFCDQFTAFLRRTQFGPGEAVVEAQPDFAGAYGFSPFLPPHATPVGSRLETTLSAYNMDRRLNLPPSVTNATREQILAGARFLLAHQIRDDAAWLMPNPEAARGGLLMSDVARYVRIDFVQHSCSAMLRAADLL